MQFTGLRPGERPLLLFSGWRADACRAFEMHVGTPEVTLVDVSYVDTCPVEVDAFAPSRGGSGLTLDPGNASEVQWLKDAIVAGSAEMPLREPTTLPVRFWLMDDVAEAEAERDIGLAEALPVLADLATGFRLDTSSKPLAAIDKDCSKAAQIASDPALHDPMQINVYFVEWYLDQPYSSYARNCWPEGYPQITFISWGNPYTPRATLMHELGHILGLIHPKAPMSSLEIGGGHTDNVAGFSNGNVMLSGISTVGDITVGQLYAMNFGASSWVNRAGSPQMGPVVRTCQDTWGTGVCPRLVLAKAGWPP